MKKLLKYKRIYLLGLIPISILLTYAAKQSSYFAEQIYAKHIYKWLSQMVSMITGLFPFSIAEALVVGVPVALLVIIIKFLSRLILVKENRKERLFKAVLNVLSTASLVLFLFTIMGGLNYYRYSFSQYSNLEIKDSSIDELYSLTKSLALQANELRAEVPKSDENRVFQLSMSNYELAKEADIAFKALTKEYPILSGNYAKAKPVLLSEVMSSTEITGIFFPFTMEANVNVDIPDYSVPSTMFHEMAHLRGFMREDEANYLAYLVGMKSEDAQLQYSSTMLALITASNALYDQNKDLYYEIRDLYSEGVLKDIRENSQYWQKYDDTVVSTVSNKINDTYLKANAQTDGVQSYGRMLDLLLAQYREDHQKKYN